MMMHPRIAQFAQFEQGVMASGVNEDVKQARDINY